MSERLLGQLIADWSGTESSVQQKPDPVGKDDLGIGLILGGYVYAIKKAVESGDRRRFVTAQKMCEQANRLLELVAVSAGDINALARTADYDIDTDGGCIINGALMPRGGFGQDGDALRQIIATLTATVQPTVAKNQADTQTAKAAELEHLLRARKLMTKAEAESINSRIDVLRKEIVSRPIAVTSSKDQQP